MYTTASADPTHHHRRKLRQKSGGSWRARSESLYNGGLEAGPCPWNPLKLKAFLYFKSANEAQICPNMLLNKHCCISVTDTSFCVACSWPRYAVAKGQETSTVKVHNISQCCQTKEEWEDRAMVIRSTQIIFGESWMYGFWDMHANRHIWLHTSMAHSSQYA